MLPLATSNRGQLCTLATAALKGEPCGWHQISCSKCTKKIWREKMTTTRTAGMPSTCIKCSQPRRRQSATQLAVPTSSNARPAPMQPSEAVLDDLGVSMDTFRRIRNLQAREITANDYDLLMRLHSKPSVKVLDEEQLEACTETFTASTASAAAGESCAVCLGTMSPGEKLCRLACDGGHTFHAHCIGEWLRTASRCCPVDQQDLAVIGLSA